MNTEITNEIKQITNKSTDNIIGFFEHFIFGGRWVIAPMYVGLLVALGVYTLKFVQEVISLFGYEVHLFPLSEAELMLKVLSLVDATMLGNLIILIMVGSYTIFVRKIQINGGDQPKWLEGITSSTLKIKMGMSLVGVSTIHLLKDFIAETPVPQELLIRHIVVHIVFILSTIALAYTDKLAHSNESKH